MATDDYDYCFGNIAAVENRDAVAADNDCFREPMKTIVSICIHLILESAIRFSTIYAEILNCHSNLHKTQH